ncbi:MAG: YybH family protein [Agriterribacter sp.]
MLRYLLFAAVIFILNGCAPEFRRDKERINALNAMQQTDVDFSNRCREVGMRKAFLEFIDDEGVLLRPGRMPIVGADAVDFITQINDSSFTLTWSPEGGNIAGSSDMGYTFGVYEMQMEGAVHKGTYVTIWKKQADGNWKFVLDSGNEGVEAPGTEPLPQ